MKGSLVSLLLLGVLITTILPGCKKEYSCEGCNTNNKPPLANAGADQSITLPSNSVLLDGSFSTDPDGNIKEWQWTKIAGPASFLIVNSNSAQTSVGSLAQGIYQLELKVTDDKGATDKDTVQVNVTSATINNQPPVACAGPDHTITLPVNSVVLNGSCSTDPDNNITGYLWVKISGPTSFSIANANAVQTQVTGLVQGIYEFELKVTDAGGLFSKDTVQVIVGQQPNNSLVDIYVAGEANGAAAYWKNGELVTLGSTSGGSGAATSIAVVGSDVYIAGWGGDAFSYGNNVAKYWKNGQEVLLTGAVGAEANSITVVGNDVYVAGWETIGSKTYARYWKNGQPVSLTNGSLEAEATCIVVVGGSIYVSGHEGKVAKYWKDGQAVPLTDGLHDAYAHSIAVVGNNVYVAGAEHNGISLIAKYWKNGQSVPLTNGATTLAAATSIVVAGTDVYVAGWEGDDHRLAGGSGSTARYWKNGQAVALTDGKNYGYVNSIALSGGNVYVAGVEITLFNTSSNYSAKYWKNGQAVTLPAEPFGGWANSIFVVPR